MGFNLSFSLMDSDLSINKPLGRSSSFRR